MAHKRRSRKSLLLVCIIEQLEQRRLLDGNPVIVIAEPFWEGLIDPSQSGYNINSDPTNYLWHNPNAAPFDIPTSQDSPAPWSTTGGDGAPGTDDGDDYYGWNYSNSVTSATVDTPQVYTYDATEDSYHAQIITAYTVETLNNFASEGDTQYALAHSVSIMYVEGTPDQIEGYVDYEKVTEGINIVAIGTDRDGFGVNFTDDEANELAAQNILIFTNSGFNAPYSVDSSPADTDGADIAANATPRFNAIEAPLENVIPLTTDPNIAGTAYGENSTYFAVPGFEAQSWLSGPAAAYAAIAVAAYQYDNDGQSPTYQQVKEAMMSGVDYEPQLDGMTITHDYVDGARSGGGELDIAKIVQDINAYPLINSFSVTPTQSSFAVGTEATITLSADNDVQDYTINWGDNTPSEVIDGSATTASHIYEGYFGDQHTYYVTVFAVTGDQIEGDVNGDGVVDANDLNTIIQNWNKTGTPGPAFTAMGDLNGDGVINQLDLNIVTAHWAETATPGLVYTATPAQIVITSMPADNTDHTYTISRNGDDVQIVRTGTDGTFTWEAPYASVPYVWMLLDDPSDTVNIDLTNGNPFEGTLSNPNAFWIVNSNNIGNDQLVVIPSPCDQLYVGEGSLSIGSTAISIPDMPLAIEINNPSDSVEIDTPFQTPVTVNGTSDEDSVAISLSTIYEGDPVSVNNVGTVILKDLPSGNISYGYDSLADLTITPASIVYELNLDIVYQENRFQEINENNVSNVVLDGDVGSSILLDSLDVERNVSLAQGMDLTLELTNSLSITDAGTLDLTDNTLEWAVYDASDPSIPSAGLNIISGLIQSAYDGGLWDGTGITSVLAQTDPSAMEIGYIVSAIFNGSGNYRYSVITVKAAHYGDFNLDGQVDQNDLNTVIENWNATGAYWFQGDANYDGIIDASDLNTVIQNWNWNSGD